MSEPTITTPAVAPALPRPLHWALVGLLLLALLLLGLFSERVISWLIATWQRLAQASGAGHYAAALQQGLDGGIAKRPLPAIATYAGAYLGSCLLLLRLLLRPAQWRLAAGLYAGLLLLYVGLTVVAKLAGGLPWLYKLSRQLLDFVVSPLPVAGLYVLFRAGFGPAEPAPAPAPGPGRD